MQKTVEHKEGISGSALKWIAVISMLIDHVACVLLGKILVNNGIYSVGDISAEYIQSLMAQGSIGFVYLAYQIMRRIIGRLAFPIFCFCLVEGFMRTGNKKKYAGRLMLFAILSEVPFDLAFWGKGMELQHQNVFFALLLGFLMMWGMEAVAARIKNEWLLLSGQMLLFVITAFLAEAVACDYGWKGIFAIMLLYLFRYQKGAQLLAGCVAFCWEPTAMLAFIPVGGYSGKRGKQNKWFFYVFYPAHLLLLYFISRLI